HEYFHNWTGNRITCRDWFQLCLKEGLTVFRDQEFTAEMRSRAVKRISDVRMLKTHQFPEDSGPLAHPVRPDSYIEINNFYTATVYEKGAELCRMIRTILGEDGFRDGMDLYFERHDGEAATVEDFIACMSNASGKDLHQFMRWYEQAGTPELACSLSYDAGKKTAEIKISQITAPTPGQPVKQPLHIPVRLGLLGHNGDDLPLTLASGDELADGLVHVCEDDQTFRFIDLPARPIPSLLRDFSAPVNLTTSLNTHDLEFLMANDSDPFNRWQAGQSYAMTLLVDGVAAVRAGNKPESAGAFAKALGATVTDERLEPAYRAEMLKLPSESDMAREIGKDIDPDAIHRAREILRAETGHILQDTLADLYKTHTDDGPYAPDAESAGRRALRNAALSLLAATGERQQIDRVARHYQTAQNMTDAIAALGILTHLQDTSRVEAFDDFYQRWSDDHLVIDKWFMLQAISSLSTALDNVRALTQHSLFSFKTPNKVRALIGAFAAMNPAGFNRSDGVGYDFVADCALKIDSFNPQVAARLMGSFKSWRMLEPARRKRAGEVLERVSAADGLSRDTYEIVTKTLD
ncbi:MAG: aminopeptidase N, partial [Methyloligellaceae bacterium]